MLPDKTVYPAKKSNNILQLQTTVSCEKEHFLNKFNLNRTINYLTQVM